MGTSASGSKVCGMVGSVLYECAVSERLDRFLIASFPTYSRSYFQRLIIGGYVKVSSVNVLRPSYKLKFGERVEVEFVVPEVIDLSPKPVDFTVVDLQDDFVIINKPPGISVHPSPSAPGEVTLVHGLLYKFKELAAFADTERPGIVHRLDKGTSGIMIVARNERASADLAALFKARKVKKCYKAIVHGHPDRKGEIDMPIGRHHIHRHKMACSGIAMRSATTLFSVERYFEKHALVEVRIITGRTHQIRVHMAWLGHSIVGDAVYGSTSKLIDRPALHAYKCEFSLYGTSYSYNVPMPKDMEELIVKFGPEI